MKAIVRFYSTKTGELLRSKQINIEVINNRMVFDEPIMLIPGEDFKVQFTKPIFRSQGPEAPKSAAFVAAAESLGLNITEMGKPIIKYESTPARDSICYPNDFPQRE